MKLAETLIATTALATTVGFAGDSAPFLLDTADGTRIVAEGEAIPVAYSPRWGNAANCTVTTAGAPSLRTDEGEIIWTPQGIGGHTLTHTAGDLTYTAQFTVLGDDVAVAGGRLSSSAVWTADKTHLVTMPLTVPSGVSLTVEPGVVVKFMPGASLTVESGGECIAKGAIFTHIADDAVGGDTMGDGDATAPEYGKYRVDANIVEDDATEYRYYVPTTLSSSISTDMILRGNRVYVASNDVTVASGVTLTVGPGAILKFNTGCSLTVNGTLDAQGTRAAPIVFTSLKDDAHGGDTNGDGEKTYAQAGDWKKIAVYGSANFDNTRIYYASSGSGTEDAILVSGGTVHFNNSEMAFGQLYAVGVESGHFYAENAIIREYYCAFRHWPYDPIVNSVIYNCNRLSNNNGQKLYNCIIVGVNEAWDWSRGSGNTYSHCVFWNKPGFGLQTLPGSASTSNGNIWGNPLFTDPDNGDFRIAANSPCVDAGDGRVAPETDYWGRPRMDVHRVKDSGSPDADGACPDIGIYEVDGHAAVPPADLAVLRVAVPGGGRSAYAPGDTLAVSYVVTNFGATVNTTWRDTVAFSNAYGAVVHGAVVETTAALPTNGPAVMFERSVVVPPLAEGEWHVLVNANAYRDVFEQSDGDNNCGSSVETIAVAIPACTLSGTASGTVAKNAPLVRKYTAPEGRPYALRVAAPAGATVAYGVGVLPSGGAQSTAIVGADGYAYVSIPAGATVYVEVASERQGNVEIASFEAGLFVHSVSSAMLPQSGDATLTVAGLHFGPDAEVSLSDGRMSIVAESVSVESAERLTARFDCARLAAGAAYALSVKSGSADASLANAVTVSGEKGEARLYAKLDMPSSLRAGRSFVFYIDYANTGNVDMPSPVFTVKSDEMIFTTDYGVYTNSVKVLGLGAEGSAGVLKPGESFRMPVKAQVKATATGGVSYRLFSAWVGASDSGDELELDQFFSDDYVFWHGEEDQDEFDAIAAKMGATWGDFYRNLGDYVTHLDEYCLATFDYEQMSQSFAWHCVSEVKESTRKWEESETAGTVDANSRVRASNTRFAALRRNASGEETLWTLSELYKDWAIPVDSSQLRARTDRHNALLAMDNSCPGDVWIFNGGNSWENPVWHRLIQTNGNLRVVSSVWNADDDVYVLCHGNLHSVHSKWIFDMAYALKKRDPNCNVLAVDWGDESTAEMTIAQTARAAVILGAAGVEVGGLGGQFLGATIGIGSVFLGIRYPECAFATALDIYEVSQTAVAQLEKAGVSPGKTTVIGHSHGGHVAGNIARSLSSRGVKTKRLVGMETSSFTSHMLVPQGCRFPDSWDGRTADVSEFYKTSYWMSMGSTSLDGAKQVWGDYNFLLVGIYDSSRREFVRDHFEHQWLVGAGKSENWTSKYIKNCDANNNEGRMGAKRHDTVEEWFIDTINDEEKWKNLGFNWKGDKNSSDSAEYFGMPKSLAKEYPNRYHGVINIKDQRLELARPENVTEGWRYKEQVLEGLGGQFDTSPALDILQDNITQSIEYRILPEKFPDTIDEGNCTISFAITNAANNLSINYDDVDKWFSRNEAWGPWRKDICTGVWLCRPFEENDTGFPDESKRAIDDLRWMKIQRIKQLKIEKLSDFVRPETHDGEKYKDLALDIPEKFFNHPISSDGEEFLLVVGAGVSSKGGEHELAYDYAGDLCQSNNWFVKKVRVKPTMLKMSVDGDLLQDDDWKEIVIGKTQTTVELSLEAVADKDSNIEYSWFRSDTGTSFEGKKTAITIPVSPWEKSKLVDLTVFSMKNGKVVRSTHVTVRIIRKGGGGGGDGNGGGSSPVPTSYDPNEMAGPDGVGEKRFVQPGDWMTYTIFFENKTNATASAQFVTVVNPLGEWLDWSTFEMGDVGFGTQVDTGLTGSQNGMSDATMEGTNLVVRTEVSLDAENGVASWFLRIVSPYGDSDGWPYADDPTGFLPPNNPETHCGEGHITYRIRVREDAPGNVVITNSATIVFDYNDPIETDPAWWNTVSPIDEFLKAGEYVKLTLAELGYDVPTDGTAYNVVAKGLPAGLKLVSNKAETKKVKQSGKTKTVVVKAAKSEWWIEGVPMAAVDFFTNPPYLVITANGETTTEALPVEVSAQEVVDLGELDLGQSVNEQFYLPGVTNGWTVSGLPTGLKYATKKVTKKVKSGKKTVVQTVAEAYAVYGKTTKAGLFNITAKKKKGAYYETLKYRVLVRPKAVDTAVFGETLTNITTMAYVPVEWDLRGGGGNGGFIETALPVIENVAKVAGLPAGVTFAAKDTYGYANAKRKTGKYLKQSSQTIVGKPTKPGTYVVTFTKNVKEKVNGKTKTVAKTAQILWTVEPNDAELELGFNTAGGVVESGVVGLKYDGLMAFTATSNATVTASGLPAGMKLVRLDGGRGATALPGQTVWGFEGFTTKAGTYLVTVKATLNGKSITQRVALVVEALPAWAKGTFNGVVSGEGGLATITVSAAGKISGKFYESGTNWTVSAASYTAAEAGTQDACPYQAFVCSNVVVKYSYKVKEKDKKGKWKTVTKTLTREFAFTVSPEGLGGLEGLEGLANLEDLEHLENLDVSGGMIRGVVSMVECGGRAGRVTLPGGDVGGLVETALPGTVVTAWQNLWGGAYKAVGKKLFTTKSGNKTLAYKTFTIKATNEDGAGTGDGDLGDGRAGRATLPEGGGDDGHAGRVTLPEGATLTLKVTTAGAVTATLMYDTGKTAIDKKTGKKKTVYYKPACSSVVIPVTAPDAEEFAGDVFLYFAPSAANNFPGWSGVAPISLPVP